VAIGRNEGKRLHHCFEALPTGVHVVYVDSGSNDDSVEQARQRGIEVVELDMAIPFTAARARNAGFKRLIQVHPTIEFVQFVDGDCELLPGWMSDALEAMACDDRIAAVCGRLRERFREATIYNTLCDLEWDTTVGETSSCGGIAMIRATAFRAVGGFDAQLIAGEEPDLCFRLRRKGYRILRVAAEMALHDASMVRFGQWWTRTERGGHAYAELAARHPGMCRRDNYSIVAWGLFVPAVAFASAPITGELGLGLLLTYPVLWLRILLHRRARGVATGDAAIYAAFCVLGKFPELMGMLRYWWTRICGRRSGLIEYK
jgi:GT2 family glycosyltransferase